MGVCTAIAQGAAEQLRRDTALHAVRPASSAEVRCDPAQGRTKDEDEELAAWAEKETYDEITGAVLPPDLVRQARAEEVKFMLDRGGGQREPVADRRRRHGQARI